ncbi:baseplate J/gp47 family protein [Aliikangiella maris]|uniref:Baseplate J/gp47 family protein n=2 Tax=Aliikangiella maris TaxID=3162458 RepID=A0ABV3MKC5_9GAMM
MSIPKIKLDDRTAQDLINEMLAKIPGHTPEWTNPRIGDPGRTLIDLFAWLGDTILYRANLIPERQRLEFLRLLNIPMIPAAPAKGLLSLSLANQAASQPINVPLNTSVPGPVTFETRDEVSVMPLQGKVYLKRKPDDNELANLSGVVDELQSVYNINKGSPYIATPYFADGVADRKGIDVIQQSVDGCLWIALLVNDQAMKNEVIDSLARGSHGERLLNIGFQPRMLVPEFGERIHKKQQQREIWQWQMTTRYLQQNGEPKYFTLDTRLDTTANFSRAGIIQLALPDSDDWGIPANNVEQDIRAGVGDKPPRIDDEQLSQKLLGWIRLKPSEPTHQLAVSWLGINAISIDQLKSYHNIVVGVANGFSDQAFQLPAGSIDKNSLQLEVEENNDGFRPYQQIDLLASAGRDDRVYSLDSEAGIVKFGNNITGRQPEINRRIRVKYMRAGGGEQGNLAANNLSAIAFPGIKIIQPVATTGGRNAETLDQAEKRIPAYLKHGDRAVNREDYQRLAMNTPGVEIGRVEVLPRFKPQQRLQNIPGVISVAVLPKANLHTAPNPRPDRNILEQVHAFLEPRRPLGVELYVIGVEYVALSLSVAISYQDGYARDEVLQQVRDALRDYLWPLTPGGREQTGWPLGQTVNSQELEVVVARVSGVLTVNDINLFVLNAQQAWVIVDQIGENKTQRITLSSWQLPELNSVIVDDGLTAATSVDSESDNHQIPGIPIPVVPEIC